VKMAFQQLLGRHVLDEDGRSLGRLEVAHAEQRDGELVITEWVVGTGGLLERLGLTALTGTLLGRLTRRRLEAIGWADLDVSNPERPRLRRRRPARGRETDA
jgi:hypothetical protein